MENYKIKEIMAFSYIESLLNEDDFDLIKIAKKNKLDINKINVLFPYNSESNQHELLKIFYNNICDNVLIKFYNEIKNEDISFYEKVLEALFILFEMLYKYKKALIYVSSSLNKKLKNFMILRNHNHQLMIKLLKICGDNEDLFKLNVKALILNIIYLKNLNLFLSSKDIILENIMNSLDKDLKKTFSNNFLFNDG